MKIIETTEVGAVVAIDRTEEVVHAVRFHMETLGQSMLGLRFRNWIELARASIALTAEGISHRISSITETKEEFYVAHEHHALHLFLDDPPGPELPVGVVTPLPSDGIAATEARRLMERWRADGGAFAAWCDADLVVYRFAVAGGHAVAIRRATEAERAHGLAYVHVFLRWPSTNIVVTCGWPEDAGLSHELLVAETRLCWPKCKGDA